MPKRQKDVWDRVAQQNRLFARFCGPDSHKTSNRNKARIFRVLFDRTGRMNARQARLEG